MEEQMMTVPVELSDETTNDGDMVLDGTNPVSNKTAATDTEDDAQTGASGDAVVLPQQPEEGMYMPVYNGEVHPIRATDTQEITTLLQLGMKQRDLLPTYERLARLSESCGQPSVKQFVHDLCDRLEERHLKDAVDKYGEDGERFYQLERQERERRFSHLQAQHDRQGQQRQQEQTQRLASEFEELRQMYPQFHDVRDVPQDVIRLATQHGISLLDAQNRFVLAEQKRIDESAASQKAAAARTTGSLGGNAAQTKPSLMEAFLAGFNSRF